MKVVAAAGAGPLTDVDRTSLLAAHNYVFGADGGIDIDALASISPDELAASVTSPAVRSQAVGFLAVMATVDGAIDRRRIAAVESFAAALDAGADVVAELAEAAAGALQALAAD